MVVFLFYRVSLSLPLPLFLYLSSSGMRDDEIVEEVHKVNGCIQKGRVLFERLANWEKIKIKNKTKNSLSLPLLADKPHKRPTMESLKPAKQRSSYGLHTTMARKEREWESMKLKWDNDNVYGNIMGVSWNGIHVTTRVTGRFPVGEKLSIANRGLYYHSIFVVLHSRFAVSLWLFILIYLPKSIASISY